MSGDGTTTTVAEIPNCQLRHFEPTPATVDGKTMMGPWAYMCDAHHRSHGCGLGVGRGQRLVLEQKLVKFEHYYDHDNRCICGGEVVYHDTEQPGHGCAVEGKPWATEVRTKDPLDQDQDMNICPGCWHSEDDCVMGENCP